MVLNAPRMVGQHRHVHFWAGPIDVTTSGYDLLVAGLPENPALPSRQGATNPLDTALHGMLARLQERGIFSGALGEMLTLSTPPPPIQAAALMLMGMGTAPARTPAAMGQLTQQAMRAALCNGATSVGCLLACGDLSMADDQAEAMATAMMRGALAAVDAQNAASPMAWVFDIGHAAAHRTTAALITALRGWGQFR